MKRLLQIMLGVLMISAVLTVSAQSGVVVEGVVGITLNADVFNPLACNESITACHNLREKVYPSLFAVDPATGLLLPAAEGNFGVIATPILTPDETWTLRRDLTWSDGVPVTAYDVLFTWITRARFTSASTTVRAMRVVDEYTLEVEYTAADCAALPRANFLVLPSHSYSPRFREYVDTQDVQTAQTIPQLFVDESFQLYFNTLLVPRNIVPPTAGSFTIADIHPNEEIRLLSGDLAYILRTIEGGVVEAFVNGEVDILINPPYSVRNDLHAKPELRIVEQPGASFDMILFNVANPNRPRSAFYDSGALIDQGTHPVFAHRDVRRAVQLAINIDEIIRVAFQGDAVALASSLPPVSWGYNPDLLPVPFDPREAERLLENAGWKDTDQSGIRECHGCGTAPEGSPLSFRLAYQSGENREVAAELIARQIRRVGFDVYLSQSDSPSQQNFDAYLVGERTNPDPDQALRFSREGDLLNIGVNATSYHEDTLSKHLNEARQISGCEPESRAPLLREAQELIQQQQPYAFLYTRTDFIAARPDVVGFSPLPDHPFWNITDWRVVR